MRTKFIAGNWKMFTNAATGEALARGIASAVANSTKVRAAVCPPAPYLAMIAAAVKGSAVGVGGQNCWDKVEGAFTGEVSPRMLKDVGCRYVILGHSERRQIFKETDALVNKKLALALTEGLEVILCIGETLDERKGNLTEKVLDTQLTGSLANVSATQLEKIVIAYEPVWAIGTGVNATPEQAQEACAYVRGKIGSLISPEAAKNVIVQYGGSAKRENAHLILGQPDVDGALVGGASLKLDDFVGILKLAGL
ncbi:MAG TPA: triose-phosphate isomerase [Gemmataceae bacterium]|jgi:triosephosphate isomerase|nr:triose-phosphate isomerase [Gemmataceae bacterium]